MYSMPSKILYQNSPLVGDLLNSLKQRPCHTLFSFFCTSDFGFLNSLHSDKSLGVYRNLYWNLGFFQHDIVEKAVDRAMIPYSSGILGI